VKSVFEVAIKNLDTPIWWITAILKITIAHYDAEPVRVSQAYRSSAVLIVHFDDRYAKAKIIKFGVSDKAPEGSTVIFGDTRISF